MKKLSLLFVLVFLTNQAFAYHPNQDDIEFEKAMSALESAEKKDVSERDYNRHLVKAEKQREKLLKKLEKEKAKVADMEEGKLDRYVTKKLKKMRRRFKKVHKYLKRAANRKALVRKFSRRSKQSEAQVREELLNMAKNYEPNVAVQRTKEQFQDLGYIGYLERAIEDLKAQVVSQTDKTQSRKIASIGSILLDAYIIYSVYGGLVAMVLTIIGLVVLLVSGGTSTGLLIFGGITFATCIPGAILLYLIINGNVG
jgi:uncharacterized membrane protein